MITIAEGVVEIEKKAFASNRSPFENAIVFPVSMKKVSAEAFASSSLKEAIFLSGKTRINKGAFGPRVTIYAPAGGATEKDAIANKNSFVPK